MSKEKIGNIFFLGAGFSKEFFDLPLNNEISDILISELKKYILKNNEFNLLPNYEYENYFSINNKKNNNHDNYINLFNYSYNKILYFIIFISIILLFENTLILNQNNNEEMINFIEEIKKKWLSYKNEDFSNYIKIFLNKFLDEIEHNEEELAKLCNIRIVIDEFINKNIVKIKDIMQIFDSNFSNISFFFSRIEFLEQKIKNIKNVLTYMEQNEILEIAKISIYYFIKIILNQNNEKKICNTKVLLDNFIENLNTKESIIINFNWDTKLDSYLEKKNINIKHHKIHNSIDDFNIIMPTLLRTNKEKEISELENFIENFIKNTFLEFLNIYFVGISLTYYDEIFLQKLLDHSLNKELQVNYIYFCYKGSNHKDNCQKNNEKFKFLNFKIECYKDFKKVNSIIKNKNKLKLDLQ